MPIDNPVQVHSLMEKMEASLPIPIRATPEVLKAVVGKGDRYKLDHEFLIEKIFYSGDEGGILCALHSDDDKKSQIVTSRWCCRSVAK